MCRRADKEVLPKMKTTSPMNALISLMIALALPIAAAERAPTFKAPDNWIVIQTYEDSALGALPKINAIRKDSILSVSTRSDYSALGLGDGSKPHAKATDQQIEALPAVVEITTSELAGSGASGNRQYVIQGFSHASAKVFLDEILAFLTKREMSNPDK